VCLCCQRFGLTVNPFFSKILDRLLFHEKSRCCVRLLNGEAAISLPFLIALASERLSRNERFVACQLDGVTSFRISPIGLLLKLARSCSCFVTDEIIIIFVVVVVVSSLNKMIFDGETSFGMPLPANVSATLTSEPSP